MYIRQYKYSKYKSLSIDINKSIGTYYCDSAFFILSKWHFSDPDTINAPRAYLRDTICKIKDLKGNLTLHNTHAFIWPSKIYLDAIDSNNNFISFVHTYNVISSLDTIKDKLFRITMQPYLVVEYEYIKHNMLPDSISKITVNAVDTLILLKDINSYRMIVYDKNGYYKHHYIFTEYKKYYYGANYRRDLNNRAIIKFLNKYPKYELYLH